MIFIKILGMCSLVKKRMIYYGLVENFLLLVSLCSLWGFLVFESKEN